MKLLQKLLSAVVGVLILLGAYVGVFSLLAGEKKYPLTGQPASAQGVRGANHLHSTASDGTGDVWAIARAAKRAGLDFVVLTDHNVEVLPPPSYVNSVLVIHQVEESTPYGHVVALGASRGLTKAEREHEPIAAIQRLGAKAVLAHPVQRKNPWKDWKAGLEADGLELYSGDSLWRQALAKPSFLACAAGAYLANPTHGLMALVQPQPEATERLLEMSQSIPKAALCALDAHGRPPYELVFGTLSMHLGPEVAVLQEDPAQAAKVVLERLASGAASCVIDALGDATGFSLEGLEGLTAPVGHSLTVRLPQLGSRKARVLVHGRGKLADDGRTVQLPQTGPVQVEVQILAPGCGLAEEWRPWIISSPFMVKPGSQTALEPAAP